MTFFVANVTYDGVNRPTVNPISFSQKVGCIAES